MKREQTKRSFTLIELLVATVVIVALLAVTAPVLRGAYIRAAGTACLNQLQLCGRASLRYADDSDGNLIQYRPWTKDYWAGVLYSENYIQRRDVVACPDLPAREFCWEATYGMLKAQKTLWPCISSPGDACTAVRLSAFKDPANAPYLGDSAEKVGEGLQQIVIVEPFSRSRTWHLRHGGRADIWYPDGHAAAEDRRLGAVFGKFLANNGVGGAQDTECFVWQADGRMSENIR